MRVSTMRAPAEAQNRLDRARFALRLAEERTGLRDSAALTVQRALSSATTSALLSTSADSPQAGSSASPAPPTVLSACQDSGVLTLHGSTTLLLAALALRQGATGWCGIIGGDELGWCAATEVGLDLNRVLTIPAPLLDDASSLTVTSTLLDGVVIPIGRGASPAPVRAIEMPAGYLRRLTWTLADPQRPRLADTEELTLSLSAEGLRTGSRNAVDTADQTSHPQEVAG